MKRVIVNCLVAAAASASGVAAAADANLGRAIAANCAACHGTGGASQGAIPSLAGLKREYIVEQMQAFKAGAREATVMHQIAKGYSDEQVAAAADYLSQQRR